MMNLTVFLLARVTVVSSTHRKKLKKKVGMMSSSISNPYFYKNMVTKEVFSNTIIG